MSGFAPAPTRAAVGPDPGLDGAGNGYEYTRVVWGLRRLPAALGTHQPRLLLLMTGGNDFLRKVPREQREANLRAMLALARERGVPVLLVGVPVPGFFAGPPAFYEALAAEHGVPYEGEVLRRVLYDNRTKSDPIHPNALGYRRLAEALAATLREAGAVP